MIGRLRRRMTLLVTMILILVTAGIIFSINYANWRQIVMQAEEILDRLAENNGKRPSRKSGEERKLPEIDVPPPEGTKGRQPPGLADTLVDLSNSYQITLSEDNEVTGWTSERADLYSDEQIEEFAAAALAESRSSGRIGTQFYRFLSEGKTRMLLVLDQRLEIMRVHKGIDDARHAVLIVELHARPLRTLAPQIVVSRLSLKRRLGALDRRDYMIDIRRARRCTPARRVRPTFAWLRRYCLEAIASEIKATTAFRGSAPADTPESLPTILVPWATSSLERRDSTSSRAQSRSSIDLSPT